jgi:hypothetical protein
MDAGADRKPDGTAVRATGLSEAAFEAFADPSAPPGNVLPALARLLLDLARQERTREEQAGTQDVRGVPKDETLRAVGRRRRR